MFKTDVFSTALAAAIALVPEAAAAAGAAPARSPAGPRYVMEKTTDGIVRMDTATGVLTFCREAGGRLSCTGPTGRHDALGGRLDRLEVRISKLEAELADLKDAAKPLPSDKQLDHAMSAFDRVMRHFFKMVQDFDEEFRNEPKKQDNSARPSQKT